MKNVFQESLNFISESQTKMKMYFILNKNGIPDIKAIDMNDDASIDLLARYKSYFSSIENDEDLCIHDLSTIDERKNLIYKYDLADYPSGITILRKNIENKHPEFFSFKIDSLSDIDGVVTVLANATTHAISYKKNYSLNLVKKEKFGFIRGIDDRFNKVKDDILEIKCTSDFIWINNDLYIFDLPVFEKFFGYHEAIKSAATKNIQEIAGCGILKSVDRLNDSLSDLNLTRKLSKIAKNSPVLKGGIPFKSIIDFTKNHPKLQGVFKYDKKTNQIDLKSKRAVNYFIKLLNDDFLHSELTQKHYESIAKDPVDPAM